MLYLKQATASQSVLIGPFIDETDGITAMTGLTIANTDIRLSANGGNIAAKNSGGGTHDELGYYTITLDVTDTATVGRLQLMVHATGAMPVYHEYQVLEEALYDALYAASATGALPVSANGLTASALAADAAAEIADAVWDEAGAGHIASGTTGNYLFNLFFQAVAAVGGVSDASASTTAFNTTLTQADDIWNDQTLIFITGNLAGHARPVSDYQNTNGRIVFDEALIAAPDNGSLFIIRGDHVHPVSQIQSGLATAAGQTDIQSRLPAALVSGNMPVSIEAVNGVPIQGDGSSGNKWRPA
jgi:hypothetical protein